MNEIIEQKAKQIMQAGFPSNEDVICAIGWLRGYMEGKQRARDPLNDDAQRYITATLVILEQELERRGFPWQSSDWPHDGASR